MNILDYNGLKRLIGLVKEALGGKADAADVYSRSVINTILANAQEELDGKADKVREVGLDQPLYRYDVIYTGAGGSGLDPSDLMTRLLNYYEGFLAVDENAEAYADIVAGIESYQTSGMSGEHVIANVTSDMDFYNALNTVGVDLDSEGMAQMWGDTPEETSDESDLLQVRTAYEARLWCSEDDTHNLAAYVAEQYATYAADPDNATALDALTTAITESVTADGGEQVVTGLIMDATMRATVLNFFAMLDEEGLGGGEITEGEPVKTGRLLLPPNTMVTLGAVDALDLALATPTAGLMNVYAVSFTCATDATTLTLPTGMNVSGTLDAPEMKSGRKFELSIYDNLCLYTYYDPE